MASTPSRSWSASRTIAQRRKPLCMSPLSTRLQQYFGRLLLLTIPLVLAFAVGEVFLRLTDDSEQVARQEAAENARWLQVVKSADLGWIFPPDTTGVFKSSGRRTPVTTNAWGLRGPSVPLDSLTRRVLILGDSYAFGWGVPDQEGFVRLLEDSLRALLPDRPLACINGGLPGYSIYQQVRMLDYVRDRMPITAVVATISLANDPVDELRIRRFAPDHLVDFSYELRDPHSLAARVIEASRLLTLIDQRTTNVQFSLRNTDEECCRLADSSLTELAQRCQADHIPLVWVIVPRAQEIRSGTFWRRGINGATDHLRTHFLEIARDLVVPVVDLKPALQGVQANQEAYLPGDAHWNAAGHRAVAEAVLPALRQVLPDT